MDHRNPRLVQSHWDVDDEFINLSIKHTSTSIDWGRIKQTRGGAVLTYFIAGSAACTIFLFWAWRIPRSKQTRPAHGEIRPCNHMDGREVNSSPMRKVILVEKMGGMEPVLIGEESTEKKLALIDHCKQLDNIAGNADHDQCADAIDKRAGHYDQLLSRNHTSLSMTQSMENEAIAIVEDLKVVSLVFQEQGLDIKLAQDFVLQRHLTNLQKQSQHEDANQRLAVELKLRSLELEMKERRHRESLTARQIDPDWVTKCLAARNLVLNHTTTASFWLLTAVVFDRLYKSGMTSLRLETVSMISNFW